MLKKANELKHYKIRDNMKEYAILNLLNRASNVVDLLMDQNMDAYVFDNMEDARACVHEHCDPRRFFERDEPVFDYTDLQIIELKRAN